jgi:hypothetical protein
MPITISGTTVTYNDSSTTTTNTPNATAALSAGAVGSYAMLLYPGNTTTRAEGFTIAGSSLRYSNTSALPGNTPGGSWRLMGGLPSLTTPTPKGVTTSHSTTSVWLRYA